MAEDFALVDLSLFAESPTNDHSFSMPRVSRQQRSEETAALSRYRSQTLPSNYTNKPLPPLPTRRLCPRPRVAGSRGCETENRCILKRIQRMGSHDQSPSPTDTLLQRRNPLSPPALTLSVPQSQPWNRNPASAMIWLPDEQMWIITGEGQRSDTEPSTYQAAYPSPPPYTPRPIARSEPSSSIRASYDLTPPLTPVQCQLQSLIQPPSQRDEERLSPLFQEAMNSVPMLDPEELILPSLSVDTNLTSGRDSLSRFLRPQQGLERSASDVSPQSTPRFSGPVRSASAGSRVSYARSDTSDRRSFHSAMSADSARTAKSADRLSELARRVARLESVMQ